MSVDANWNGYRAFAAAIAAGPLTETMPQAVFRSAISRAYYAAYHAGSTLVDHLGLRAEVKRNTQGNDRHKATWTTLKDCLGQAIYDEAVRLKEERHVADYMPRRFDLTQVKVRFAQADRIIRRCEEVVSSL